MSSEKSTKGLSLASVMILSMVLGIGTGIFFGEMVGWMGIIGNAVIMLMQMTIYPYILVSLISSIGNLDPTEAKRLFIKAGSIMAAIWVIGLIVVLLTPITFPSMVSASFFSSSEVQPRAEINYLKLYIPSNPFESMASGAVPALVLFSIALGVALISVKNKERVIHLASTCAEGLAKITQSVVKILPIGVFAMSANAAGTMGIDELESLQVFMISYFVLCMLLAFVILPVLITSFTPFSYRDVMTVSWGALATAFSTGNIFICLPVIMEESKRLLKKYGKDNDEAMSLVDVVLPIVFTFPNLGKLTIILFIFFAGWFIGKPVDLMSYPLVGISGLLSLFGSVYVAVPFLLESVFLPSDLNQLFVVSSFITGRFNSLVAVMNLMAVTMLSAIVVVYGVGKPKLGFIRFLVISCISTVLIFGGTRVMLEHLIGDDQNTSSLIADMKIDSSIISQGQETGGWERKSNPNVADLDSIAKARVLRVGYQRGNVPFSYHNSNNELVGFDISLAYRLASDLGVDVEFVPYMYQHLADDLERGYFDIAMSGIEIDAELMKQVSFTNKVLDLNLALIVPDHQVKHYSSIKTVRQSELNLAVVQHAALVKRAEKRLPQIDFSPIVHYESYFNPEQPHSYDGLLTSAEAGYAWSLFYPDFGVALLKDDVSGRLLSFPTAFAVARRNTDLLNYTNNWLDLMKSYHFVDRQYDYWIQGYGAVQKESRWSVIKDVLGWVNG
ncbi:cation:dicarboxylate symporter family transporter [Echinimonas agarilytica]|uniref:Cation:dicarboxylase symporter family transporter n=1 Tax=Echinimonas agarilytica TaxID=1215918 RepID=A0AA41W3Q3_9GAMM|nr:cation:dicarboxylase symporter family transporter [Echinimonas agarilytica]MCM2678229.1 cation:dicarboxylase symporter family transporter [Echinimonas agarilytica]